MKVMTYITTSIATKLTKLVQFSNLFGRKNIEKTLHHKQNLVCDTAAFPRWTCANFRQLRAPHEESNDLLCDKYRIQVHNWLDFQVCFAEKTSKKRWITN